MLDYPLMFPNSKTLSTVCLLMFSISVNGSMMNRPPISVANNVPTATVKVVSLICSFVYLFSEVRLCLSFFNGMDMLMNLVLQLPLFRNQAQ